MKILVHLTFRESPLRLYYHDNHTGYTTETTTSWLQTRTLPVIMIDSFQTSVTDVRYWKWFTETSQIINVSVTGQTHSCPYHYYILIIIQYYSSTRKHPKLSLPCLACTHTTHTLLLCCALKLLLSFLRTSQTKSQPTVWPIADFLLTYILILTSILPVNANPDYITIIMPAHQ